MIDFVIPGIAIGNALAAGDATARRAAGIRSILCLNGELAGRTAADLGVEALRVFDLIDGRGNDAAVFDAAVGSVAELSRAHPPLLVHCTAGQSRSAIVVASHLARTQGLMLADAIDLLRANRRLIFPPRILIPAWDVDAEGRIRRPRRPSR